MATLKEVNTNKVPFYLNINRNKQPDEYSKPDLIGNIDNVPELIIRAYRKKKDDGKDYFRGSIAPAPEFDSVDVLNVLQKLTRGQLYQQLQGKVNTGGNTGSFHSQPPSPNSNVSDMFS